MRIGVETMGMDAQGQIDEFKKAIDGFRQEAGGGGNAGVTGYVPTQEKIFLNVTGVDFRGTCRESF